MIPAAVPRCAGGNLPITVPISIEKLPAPAPIAVSIPIVNTRPELVVNTGVSAVPNARISTPLTSTGAGPKRSATAPATGATAPHINCPTAIAKLIVTMLTPVEPLMGKTNNPCDCRAPIVIINIAAAAKTT